jgi:hypothetical protein
MRATSLRGKKRRDAEQDKIRQLLTNCGPQFLETLVTLDIRRNKMPTSGATSENAISSGAVLPSMGGDYRVLIRWAFL